MMISRKTLFILLKATKWIPGLEEFSVILDAVNPDPTNAFAAPLPPLPQPPQPSIIPTLVMWGVIVFGGVCLVVGPAAVISTSAGFIANIAMEVALPHLGVQNQIAIDIISGAVGTITAGGIHYKLTKKDISDTDTPHDSQDIETPL